MVHISAASARIARASLPSIDRAFGKLRSNSARSDYMQPAHQSLGRIVAGQRRRCFGERQARRAVALDPVHALRN
jgi:hypothetical protein